MHRTIIVGSVAVVGFAAAPAFAQESSYPVAIVVGACDDLGEVVAELDDAVPAEGDVVGAETALAAAESFTTVEVPFDTVLGDPHAVVVGEPDAPLVCGEVGGFLDEEGGVTFGLAAEGESDLSGLAYLAPARRGARTFGQVALVGIERPAEVTEEQPAAGATPEAEAEAEDEA